MIEFIANWSPLIIFFPIVFGAIILLSRKQMKNYDRHVADVKEINNEIVAINREMIAELREIKQILKDQK